MKQNDLLNSRAATGWLGYVSELKEFKSARYFNFLIRHFVKAGKRVRVTDYWFSGNQELYDIVSAIPMNSPLVVTFEIKTVRRDFNDDVNYNVKLKAKDVYEFDDNPAPEWIWKLKDWDDSNVLKDLKLKYPDPPAIQRARAEYQRSITDETKDETPAYEPEEEDNSVPF